MSLHVRNDNRLHDMGDPVAIDTLDLSSDMAPSPSQGAYLRKTGNRLIARLALSQLGRYLMGANVK